MCVFFINMSTFWATSIFFTEGLMFCVVKILVQQFVTGNFNPIHIHCFKKTRDLEPIKDVEHITILMRVQYPKCIYGPYR